MCTVKPFQRKTLRSNDRPKSSIQSQHLRHCVSRLLSMHTKHIIHHTQETTSQVTISQQGNDKAVKQPSLIYHAQRNQVRHKTHE